MKKSILEFVRDRSRVRAAFLLLVIYSISLAYAYHLLSVGWYE